MRKLLVILSLLTAACQSAPAVDFDPRYGEHPEGGKLPEGVRKVELTFDIRSDVHEECMRASPELAATLPPGHHFNGCAFFPVPSMSWCRVVIAPDATETVVRHEIAHCLKGKWHG